MKKVFRGIVGAVMLSAGVACAENGVSDSEIVLGQSCATTGPAEALGKGMKLGMNAYFSKINDEGGIAGKKVKLITKDDGYEPDRAIANTKALINDDKVFMLIGEVGTPTSKAVVPTAEAAKVPFFGPFTGAEFLRNPYKKYVINVRASYNQEMEKLAEYLVDKKGMKKIALFYQNDGYGQAGKNGIVKALKKRDLVLCGEGTYERNTVAVKGGLMKIRKSEPDAVIMVGAYKPCAEFIKLGKKFIKGATFCNISFVGTKALKSELGASGEGCIVSQVVSFPWDTSISLVQEYTDVMKKYAPGEETGFVSLEGYMVAKLFCMVAAKTPTLTREAFIETVNSTGTFDLGGITLTYGPDDHQGMDKVFLTVIKGGEIKPLD